MEQFIDVWSMAIAEPEDTTEQRLYVPATVDNNGFLNGGSVVTNIGIFTYRWPDGSIKKVLRHPDDVFDQASLASLALKPITDNHPTSKRITPEDYKELVIGSVGSNVQNDGYNVYVDWTINDATSVQKVGNGKRSWSCGYSAKLIDQSGNYLGVDYDLRQTEIRYNHLALVDVGRAGDAAKIMLDSNGDEIIEIGRVDLIDSKDITKGEQMSKVNLVVDSISYEVDDAFASIFKSTAKERNEALTLVDSLKEEVKTAKSEKESLKAQVDAKEAELAALKIKLEDAKTLNPQVIDAAVTARLDLISVAAKAEVDTKDLADELAIKKAIIVKALPAVESKLADASSEYMDAMYVAAKAVIDERTEVNGANRVATSSFSPTKTTPTLNDADDVLAKADAARLAYYSQSKSTQKENG